MHKRILIVDDEPMIREVLKESFEAFGFAVDEAASGNEAFRKICESANYDCVLSDVRMPDGSGLDLARSIDTLSGLKPKVFLVTGFSETDIQKTKEWGVVEVFEKPFEIKKVIAAIETALHSSLKSGALLNPGAAQG